MLERSDRTLAMPGVIKRLPIGYGRNIPFPPVDFPDYVYSEWPKIVQQTCDEAYQEAWRQTNSYIDERTSKRCYTGGMPKLGTLVAVLADAEAVHAGYADVVGDPVVLHSADDERRWTAARGPVAPAPPAPLSGLAQGAAGQAAGPAPAANPEVAALRAEIAERRALNAELAELIAEGDRLRAQLDTPAPAPRKPGWPKGKSRKPAVATESAA